VSASLQLYLIRHGETAWSITGQHTGVTDIALTPHGEEEARAWGPLLRAIHFSRVLTSPLLRARQTCDLAGLGIEKRIEPDLAECNYGDYEGSPVCPSHCTLEWSCCPRVLSSSLDRWPRAFKSRSFQRVEMSVRGRTDSAYTRE